MLEIDWKTVWTGLVGFVLGGALTWLGRSVLEMRRRIRSSIIDSYFGPALTYNSFMGRNYPSDYQIGLDFKIRLFSEKSQPVSLHNFQLQFCRSGFPRTVVVFSVDAANIYPNLNGEGPHTLDVLELLSKQFVTLDLSISLGREEWQELQSCNWARLVCKTAEGRSLRFPVRSIQMPQMPPEGIKGQDYMSVQVNLKDRQARSASEFIIDAVRRQPNASLTRPPGSPKREIRYWKGCGWAVSKERAKIYSTHEEARAEGEAKNIWNIVPNEWRERKDNDRQKP